jgi:hypothetical protein
VSPTVPVLLSIPSTNLPSPTWAASLLFPRPSGPHGQAASQCTIGLASTPAARDYHVSPNQLRPALASSAQKGYNYRRTGLAKEHQYTTKTDFVRLPECSVETPPKLWDGHHFLPT